MCLACVYKGSTEIRTELQALIAQWDLVAKDDGIRMAEPLSDALKQVFIVIGKIVNPDECEGNHKLLNEQLDVMGEFAHHAGGAHYIIRIIMGMSEPDNDATKHLLMRTRKMADFFFSCLGVDGAPTLDIENAMSHFKQHLSKMVENGRLVPVDLEERPLKPEELN